MTDEGNGDADRPGPKREADAETQADAGLDGGATEADEGERVGAEDEDDGGGDGGSAPG